MAVRVTNQSEKTKDKNKTHPCFNAKAHEFARMHLPVAPKCNIQCNYCHRKFDCTNESRPGVSSEVLNPEEALMKYKETKKKFETLSVVGIAGPGDALACELTGVRMESGWSTWIAPFTGKEMVRGNARPPRTKTWVDAPSGRTRLTQSTMYSSQ